MVDAIHEDVHVNHHYTESYLDDIDLDLVTCKSTADSENFRQYYASREPQTYVDISIACIDS